LSIAAPVNERKSDALPFEGRHRLRSSFDMLRRLTFRSSFVVAFQAERDFCFAQKKEKKMCFHSESTLLIFHIGD